MAKAIATTINAQDVAYSSTLLKSDIGKSAVIANGCFYIKESHERACELARLLNE